MSIHEEAINRMLRILERFARKLAIAVSIPVILRYEKFRNICEQHGLEEIRRRASESPAENDRSSDGRSGVVHLAEESSHPQWPVILENLRKYENEISTTLSEAVDDAASSYKEIIKQVESLKKIVEWQMRLTPKQLRERRIELRNAKTLTSRTEAEIARLEGAFKEKLARYDEAVQKSEIEIRNLRGTIEEMRREHREALEREITCYETTLRRLRTDSAEEGSSLRDQLKAHERMLEALTLANLEQETCLRELCKEAESAHSTARNAHDQELGQLDELKEALEAQLGAISGHHDILKNEYEVQSVLFLNLKKERELAMMQAFAEQLDNFEKNRAARVIQRTWRAYHERVSSKKKKKARRTK